MADDGMCQFGDRARQAISLRIQKGNMLETWDDRRIQPVERRHDPLSMPRLFLFSSAGRCQEGLQICNAFPGRRFCRECLPSEGGQFAFSQMMVRKKFYFGWRVDAEEFSNPFYSTGITASPYFSRMNSFVSSLLSASTNAKMAGLSLSSVRTAIMLA